MIADERPLTPSVSTWIDHLKNWASRYAQRVTDKPVNDDSTERTLIDNIEDLSDLTAEDVMVPRVDIVAIEINSTTDEFINLFRATPHSRIPVYQGALDDILGFIHIKDVLSVMAQGQPVVLRDLLRETMIISPAMPALDVLFEMRKNHRNLALVIDEYGGIDGLVTMGDLIEAIIGEMNDEHKLHNKPRLMEKPDGSIIVDGRYAIDDLEEIYGEVFAENEREEADTLAGLAMFLAGRLPQRGEILSHESGVQLEILDADSRRVKRLRLRNLSKTVPKDAP